MPQFISPSHVWWVWPCYEFTGNATFSQMHVISFNSEVHKRAQGRKRIGKKNFKKRWLRVTNQELSYHKQKGEWSQLWVHDKVTPPVQFWNVGVKPQTLVFAGSVSHGKVEIMKIHEQRVTNSQAHILVCVASGRPVLDVKQSVSLIWLMQSHLYLGCGLVFSSVSGAS